MKHSRIRLFFLVQILVVLVFIKIGQMVYSPGEGPRLLTTSSAAVSSQSRHCVSCHTQRSPAIVAQWRDSRHAKAGVACAECHAADEGEPDAQPHFNAFVSPIVSPKDCGACHAVETEQFVASHHAKGGEVLGSLDNYLGEVVEGWSASVNGCQQCHGSKVAMTEDKKLRADTWPNFGIGRINPDGSAGACSACHSRHDFALSQARSPETCGRCHMGPDHPQKEVYEESKHGIAYRAHMDVMNMDQSPWVLGVDYSAAPVCATCHVSATPNQARTHDIGLRLSWNLRPAISKRQEGWEGKRKAMQEVCANCHSPGYVKNFYTQFDAGVNLYDDKFGKPAAEVMKQLRDAEKLDATPFNEKIEWTYFFLWHHEGRRARHGLAMMGPDYVQWHGFYEIAHRFYMEFEHEAEELMPGVMDEIMSRPEHRWRDQQLTPEERSRIRGFYKGKYNQAP